jgi:transcriptional regulator with XRE-family HTH domain
METQAYIDTAALRALREAHGMDQATLAARAGLDKSVISRLERGVQRDFRVSVLIRLAQVLDTSVESLLHTPYHRTRPALGTELAAVLDQVESLSPAHQQRVASLLRWYLMELVEP